MRALLILKSKNEVAKLEAEIALLHARRQATAHRTVALAGFLVPLIVSIVGVSIAGRSTFASIKLSKDAEARQLDSARAEADTRLMSIYATEVLYRMSGRRSSFTSQSCFDHYTRTHPAKDGDAAVQHCSGGMPLSNGETVAIQMAALEIAKRYPLLCAPTKTMLSEPFNHGVLGHPNGGPVRSLLSSVKCQE